MLNKVNIKYCPLCGISVPFGKKFCPKCNYDLNNYHASLEKIILEKKSSQKSNQVDLKFCPSCGTKVSSEENLCPKCEYNLNDYRTLLEKFTLDEKTTATVATPTDNKKELKKVTLEKKLPLIMTPLSDKNTAEKNFFIKEKTTSTVTPLLDDNTAIENTKLEKKLMSTVNSSSDNLNRKESIISRIKIRFPKKAYMAVGTVAMLIVIFYSSDYISDISEPSKQPQSYAESITTQKEETLPQQEVTKQEIPFTSEQKAEKEILAQKEENIVPLKENQTKKESVTVQEKKIPPQQEEQKVSSVSNQKPKEEPLTQREETIAPFKQISPEEEIARQTFINYHQAIVNGDYETAYSMLTSEQKRRVGNFNRYINSHSDMLDGIVTDVYTMKSSPESITIGYRLTVDERMPDDKLRTQIFRGQVTLVEREGYWYILNAQSRKAEEFIRKNL